MSFKTRPAGMPRQNSSVCELPRSPRNSEPVCDLASTYKLWAKMGESAGFNRSRSPSPSGGSGSCCSCQSDTLSLVSTSHAPFIIGPDSETEAESVDLEDDYKDYHDRITWTSKNSITLRNSTTKGSEKYKWNCEDVYDALLAVVFGETASCNVAAGLLIDLPFSANPIQAFFERYLPQYSAIPMRYLRIIFWRARLDIGEKHNENMIAMRREARRFEMIQAHQIYHMRKAEGAKTPEAMQFVCDQINSKIDQNSTKDDESDKRGSRNSGIRVEDNTKSSPQAGLEYPYHRTVPIMLRPINKKLEQSSEYGNDGHTVTSRGGVGSESWSESTDRNTDPSLIEHIRSTACGYALDSESFVPMYTSTNLSGVQSFATTEYDIPQSNTHQNSNTSFDQSSQDTSARTIERGNGKRKQIETNWPQESPPKKLKSDDVKAEWSTRRIAFPLKHGKLSSTMSLDLKQAEADRVDSRAANFFSKGAPAC